MHVWLLASDLAKFFTYSQNPEIRVRIKDEYDWICKTVPNYTRSKIQFIAEH